MKMRRLYHAMSRTAVVLACLLAAGCRDADDERQISATSTADEAGVVRLSAEQQRVAGLKLARVTKQPLDETLATTGWLAVQPEHEVVVKAPALGYILPPAGKAGFGLGSQVNAGYELGSLEAILSPQEQAQLIAAKEEADTVINQSQVSMELAQSQLERLRRAEGAAAGTRLLELEEIVRKAQIAHKEAQERLPFLPKEPYAPMPKLKSVVLSAPIAGRVLQVHVSPRQLVLAGDPLWTISDWSTVWLRVPVFQADLPRLDADAPAGIEVPGRHETLSARPLHLPQSSSQTDRTTDVMYELANPAGLLRPGLAVAVNLVVDQKTPRLAVPRSAVLWDRQGGAWIYVQQGDDEFARRRVELGPTFNDQVVVTRGLAAETTVVVVGAEVLHGQQFQGSLGAADDDD